MYKKFLLLLWVQILSIPLIAQLEIKEGSFKEVSGFVNINPDENYQTDDNNLPFAVIKVRTENINDKQRRELKFSGNAGTFIMLEYKDGEVWVYLTAQYADYLKISHPDYSSIEFTLPEDLKPKCGYELTLVNKSNDIWEFPYDDYGNDCYNDTLSHGKDIIIETGHFGDKVFIDDNEVGKSPVKVVLSYGTHIISAYRDKRFASMEINVLEQESTNTYKLVLKKESLSSYVNKGYKFVTLNASMSQYNRLSYGLTVGSLKNYGWFVSAISNFNFDGFNSDFECDENFYVNGYCPEYTGNVSHTSLSVIGGFIMQIYGPVALRVGAGYGVKNTLYETTGGSWVKNTAISSQGLDISAGLQLNIRGLVVSLDCVTTNFKIYETKIGLGYGLKNK